MRQTASSARSVSPSGAAFVHARLDSLRSRMCIAPHSTGRTAVLDTASASVTASVPASASVTVTVPASVTTSGYPSSPS